MPIFKDRKVKDRYDTAYKKNYSMDLKLFVSKIDKQKVDDYDDKDYAYKEDDFTSYMESIVKSAQEKKNLTMY